MNDNALLDEVITGRRSIFTVSDEKLRKLFILLLKRVRTR